MRRARLTLAFVCAITASLMSASRFCRAQPGTDRVPRGERGLNAEGTEREPGSPAPPVERPTGFDFGSYGRLGVGTDLRGHEGYPTNVVSHGSRLEEAPYLELN